MADHPALWRPVRPAPMPSFIPDGLFAAIPSRRRPSPDGAWGTIVRRTRYAPRGAASSRHFHLDEGAPRNRFEGPDWLLGGFPCLLRRANCWRSLGRSTRDSVSTARTSTFNYRAMQAGWERLGTSRPSPA